MKTTPTVLLAISALLIIVSPENANAHDYTAALDACKTAAYKQSGLEANVNQLTRQLGDYALKEVPYAKTLVSGYAIYKVIQERRLVLKIDDRKVLNLTPSFGSITLRF